MKKLLEIFIGKEPPLNALSEYWKKAAIFLMILFATIAYISMFITNFLTGEITYYMCLNIVGIVATIICLVVLRSTGKLDMFTHVFVGILFCGSILVFVTVEAPRFEHITAYLLPVVTIFLYDRKRGIFIPSAYYAVILVLEVIFGFFGVKYFIQYSLYYGVLTFMLYFIGYSRIRTQEILELQEKEKAVYDSQTMLYSKTYMMQLMENTIANEQYFIMMFDIDNFKVVNDTKGHIHGDCCIERLAETLQKVIKNGYCGRFGGDEFIVIRPYRNRTDIYTCVSLIHMKVNERIKDLDFTVSIGVADKISNIPAAKLIYYADTALYRAKGDGKNCVRFYSPTDLFFIRII